MASSKIPADLTQFQKDKDVKWNLAVIPGTDKHQKLEEGTIYSSSVYRLGWDKGRTSSIDGKVFWNFGDCLSIDGIEKGPKAGFSMGAAFYGNASEPLRVEMVGSCWMPYTESSTSPLADKYYRAELILSLAMTLRSLGLANPILTPFRLKTGSMEWILLIQPR